MAGVVASLRRVTGLGLHHAEDIGAHYARTLGSWRGLFLGEERAVRARGFDDRFLRMWDYTWRIARPRSWNATSATSRLLVRNGYAGH